MKPHDFHGLQRRYAVDSVFLTGLCNSERPEFDNQLTRDSLCCVELAETIFFGRSSSESPND